MAFGVYVHVPFCATRCGYCDFNTYTAAELGGGGARAEWAHWAVSEVARAGAVVGERPAATVFVGGGTPTLLPAADLVAVLDAIRTTTGLEPGAEVTTEANPDSVTPGSLAELVEGGFTRISFGMQSAVPHVLATLERTHDPAGVARAVGWAREAGFSQVSLDLIYGTAGESVADWRASLEAALACEPDHVSAYSLIVERGTRLGRQVRSGLVAAPDDDDLAEKYLLADDLLTAAGLGWYEVSNWASGPATRCRHNELYWASGDWWGVGPGAHSHLAGERWWNLRHPTAWAARLAAGESPAEGSETLDAADRHLERVMLELRHRSGLPASLVPADRVEAVVHRGLVVRESVRESERLVLTLEGRLLADAVVRDLVA